MYESRDQEGLSQGTKHGRYNMKRLKLNRTIRLPFNIIRIKSQRERGKKQKFDSKP